MSQDDLGKTERSLGLAASRLVLSWARQAETGRKILLSLDWFIGF